VYSSYPIILSFLLQGGVGKRWNHKKILCKNLSAFELAFDDNTAVPLKTEEEQEVEYKESKPPTLCLQISLRNIIVRQCSNILSSTPLQSGFGHKVAFYCECNEVAARHFQLDQYLVERCKMLC